MSNGNVRRLKGRGLLVFSFVSALIAPALASPSVRDEVMSGTLGCMASQGGRQWLDCYYRATEPMRRELNLQPLPANSTSTPRSELTIYERHARDEVMSSAFRCTGFASDREWLDCYYGAAQPMREAIGLPPVPQAQSQLAGNQIHVRGSDQATAPRSMAPDEPVVSPLASYKFTKTGILTVVLTNGQVWQQIADDTFYAKLKLPPNRYIATIRSGLLGSYNLTIKGVPGLFRVRRIT